MDICLLRHVYINNTKKTMRPSVNLTINIGKKYLPAILPNSMPNLESETFLDNPKVPRVNSELFVAPIICSSPVQSHIMKNSKYI